MMTPRYWTCALLLMFAAFQQPASSTGEWQAVVGRQHLMLQIEQIPAPSSGFKGTFGNADSLSEQVPLDTVTIDSQRGISFALKAAQAVFEGKLNADGSEIAGTMHQGGANVPLVFRRPGAAPAAFTLKPVTKGRVRFEPCRTANVTEELCGSYDLDKVARQEVTRLRCNEAS